MLDQLLGEAFELALKVLDRLSGREFAAPGLLALVLGLADGVAGVGVVVGVGGFGDTLSGQFGPNDVAEVLGLAGDVLVLSVGRERDHVEHGLGEDHHVPVAVGDAGDELLAAGFGEVGAVDRQDPRAGVGLEEFVAPLVTQVVGDDDARLVAQAQAPALHEGGGDGEGLAEADGVVEEAAAGVDDGAGDRLLLVGAQGVAVGEARQLQVRSVAGVLQPGVEALVVGAQQVGGTLGVVPQPIREETVHLFRFGLRLFGLVGGPALAGLYFGSGGVCLEGGRGDQDGLVAQQPLGEVDGGPTLRAVDDGGGVGVVHGRGCFHGPVGAGGAGDRDLLAVEDLPQELLDVAGVDPGGAEAYVVDVARCLVRQMGLYDLAEGGDVGLQRVRGALVVVDELEDLLGVRELLADVAGEVEVGGQEPVADVGVGEDEVAERGAGFVVVGEGQQACDLGETDLPEGVEADGQRFGRGLHLGGLVAAGDGGAGEDVALGGRVGAEVVVLERVDAGGVRVAAEGSMGGAPVTAGLAPVEVAVAGGVGAVALVEFSPQLLGVAGGAVGGFGGEQLDVGVS